MTASCTNNPTTYAWTANNAVVGTTPSITVTPAQTTTYSVVANNAAGPSQPVSVTVQVILPPVCTISQTPPNPVDGNTRVTLTASCSNNPTIYAWTAGGVNVGATPSITVTPTQTTTYTLAATGPGGTGQATQTVQVNRVVAASIVVIAGSTTATAGKSLPAPLLARVLDGSNNPVGAGISVTWTSTDPGDTFAPQATVLTDNTGTASVNVTLSANPADRQIKACVTGTAVCSANTLLRSIQEAVLKPAAQLVGPQAAVANMAALTQLSNIRARLDERRRLQNPTVAQGLRVSHFGTMLPQMRSYALASVDQEGKPIARTDVPANANQDSFERFGLFVDGALEIGKQSSTGVQTGFDVHSNGLTIGGDYRLGGNHVIGAALGLLRASTDLDQSAGTQDARGYSFSIFGSFVPMADGYIDVIANIGRNTYDSTRHALDNSQGITSDFSSSTSGNQYALSASAGYNFNKAALTLNPYVRADFIKATVNSFSESGGQNNQGAISVGDQQYQNTFLTLGGQLSYAMSMSWGVFIPNARLELQHQSRASTKDVSAQLVSDATTNSLVPLVQSDKSFGNYALGFSAVFQRGVSAFFNYQRTFGKDNFSDAKYTLGVRAEF